MKLVKAEAVEADEAFYTMNVLLFCSPIFVAPSKTSKVYFAFDNVPDISSFVCSIGGKCFHYSNI